MGECCALEKGLQIGESKGERKKERRILLRDESDGFLDSHFDRQLDHLVDDRIVGWKLDLQ